MKVNFHETIFGKKIRALQTQLNQEDRPQHQLPLLDELVDYYIHIDLRCAYASIKKELYIAKSIDSQYWLMKGYSQIGMFFHLRARHSRSLKYLTAAWGYFKNTSDNLLDKSITCRSLSNVHGVLGNSDVAIQFGNRAVEYARLSGDKRIIANSLEQLASRYRHLGEVSKALQLLEQALELYQEIEYTEGVEMVMWHLGTTHYQLQNLDESLFWYKKSYKMNRLLGNTSGQAWASKGIAGVLLQRQQYQQAQKYIYGSLKLFKSFGDVRQYGMLWLKIGQSFGQMGNHRKALQSFERTAKLFKSSGYEFGYTNALLGVAQAHAHQEDWDKAINSFELALSSAKNIYNQIFIHQELGNVYERKESLPDALYHYKQYMVLERELQSSGVHKKLIAFSDAALRHSPNNSTEPSQENVVALKKKIEIQSRESTSISRQLEQSEKFLQELRSRIADIPDDDTNSQAIQGIISDFNTNFQMIRAWEIFEERFGQLEPAYIKALKHQYPTLTPTEYRICLLLRIKLSNKEIGSLLNISYRTVNTHRTSIRKKMRLKKKENLVAVLSAV